MVAVRSLKVTKLLQRKIEENTYQAIYWLIEQWGIWARFSGCRGYFHGDCSHDVVIIDDDTALELDRAMQSIKAKQHNLYKVLYKHFVQGMDCDDIVSTMRNLNTSVLTDYGRMSKRYNRDVINTLIDIGVRRFWEVLKDESY